MTTEAAPATPTLLLDTNDLARELRVSKRHVERLASAGALPAAVKLGRSTRYPRDKVERWIADGCPSAGTDDAKK